VGVSGSVSRKAKKEKDLQKFLVLKYAFPEEVLYA
jgi:hypothetical protein